MAVILHHYRPHLDEAKDLEAISVAREPLLDEMLSRLQRWQPGDSRQHYLLIGPRGIGKTHVLRLLQHRLSSAPGSQRKWFPLLFPEEQYAVTSVPDLLIETLHGLAETSGDRVLAQRYQRIRREANDETVVDLALDALRSFCKAGACGVLLMLENLDRLLQDQIKKDSQIGLLRKILIEEDWPVLIATSPTYLSDVTDPQKPFFEFFQVVVLDELSPEGVETLLRRRAELDGDNDFLAYLDRYRSRLRALYHFSGGNPRLTLMLYDLLSRQALTDVKIELDGLLNQLTPFYQDRMKEVGPQEAKILTTIALLAEGVTPTELAEECRMDRTLVSAVLSRLEKAGYVRREPRARKQTVYTIPERFFRIWHQMTASRAARGRIQYLLDFFSTWYATPEERDEVWDRLLAQFQEEAEDGEDGRTEDISTYMDYIATVSEGPERFRRHFGRLRQHARVGNHERVARELTALDQEFSRDADYFLHKGEFLARELCSDRMALKAFRRALDFNREKLEALFNEAVALDRLRKREAAQRAYARAAELLSTRQGASPANDRTQFLVSILRDDVDPVLIRIAAYLLGRTAPESVCNEIVEIVSVADEPWRRRHAVIALGMLCSHEAVPALLDHLHDAAGTVRASVAVALGRIRASEAVAPLIEVLRWDVSRAARGAAATALGNIGASRAVAALTDALGDRAENVRDSAATALGKMGAPEATVPLIKMLRKGRNRAIRGAAATALGNVGASEAIAPLIGALQDKALSVRGSAAAALGKIRASEAIAPLIEMLRKGRDQMTRQTAATALGRIGTSEAVLPLIDTLRDKAHRVRADAAIALGKIGEVDAVPALIEALHDRAPTVRASAARALGSIGGAEASAALTEALHDQVKKVRCNAATALGKIGAPAIPDLLLALRDESHIVRGAAAWVLGRSGAPDAALALAETLRDGALNVRAAGATALGMIATSESVPSLIRALDDPSEIVRGRSATALGRIGTPEAITAIRDAIPEIIGTVMTQANQTRIRAGGFFLRAAFRSGNIEILQALTEEFASRIENGEEVFLPHRIALDFLRSDRDPMILSRQPPEMREAVELLVSLFDKNTRAE